ncbi:sulfurtransferase [Aggregatimonas sangjinii]|uniref:Molybdopterin-synthase adenylyltransferase n=1 Tax=Aggregatimonas sangjinii TaxID=2583587 RepID=A0A5B7SU20_9FLAO|nr:HesA/MoeB/ThiF family protein [Aggregatimonas sangjinii]QCX00518.1 sulfurtransferase [Aggregatimonas sangjinii]
MNDNRYIRQTTLKGFGSEGQQKLADAKVLVVGAGGLGIPVLTYLNAMGVGQIGVMDNDTISITNLPRQVLYGAADVGKAKVTVALEKLRVQNPSTKLIGYETILTTANALEIIKEYDVVVDASDNFPTRYLVNDACVILDKPFVYGALHGYEGQVSVFNYKDGPTYRCLFPKMPKENEVPNCNEHGVLGILPGIIGNLQALETIKVLTGIGEVLSGVLLIFDGLQHSYQKINFKRKSENLEISQLQDFYEWNDPCEIIPTVHTEELAKLLADNVQIIDVRTTEEFEDYHLPSAISVPLNELADHSDKIDFSVPVYLLCQSGKRSETALKQLREQHPDSSFFSILGGLNQYLATCS